MAGCVVLEILSPPAFERTLQIIHEISRIKQALVELNKKGFNTADTAKLHWVKN